METFLVFDEAKTAFIYGCPVASTVLCSAFVEHWLSSKLHALGYSKEAHGGLSSIVQCCRKNGLLPEQLIQRVDKLRKIRNPFVHLKSFEHQHNVVNRMLEFQMMPHDMAEADARDSLATMYTIATCRFGVRDI